MDEANSISRMKPDRMLAAAIGREDALGHLQRWAAASDVDSSRASLEGIYLPFWMFDIVGEIASPQVRRDPRQPGSDVLVDVARVATMLKPYPGAREYLAGLGREEALTDRLPVARKVCVPATRRLPELLSGVARAGANEAAIAFDPARLKDWPAESYQVSPEEAAAEGRGEAVRWARQELGSWFLGREAYDTSGLRVEDFDLLLIPVWAAAVPHGGSQLAPCVHAVTGEVFSN